MPEPNYNDLIQEQRRKIRVDSYSMSIGEIIALYKDKDLILRPVYQRLFRWSDEEQSSLIESVLMGLPLPTIFVEVDESSKWSVVDGLQRISTLARFMGVPFEDAKPEHNEPLRLTGLSVLHYLNGKTYADLGADAQRLFKREKLYISSIKSDLADNKRNDAKFDLFIRLNRHGQMLTGQEIRNALITQLNLPLANFLANLKEEPNFQDVASLSETEDDVQTGLELILRFFALKNWDEAKINSYNSLNLLLDEFCTQEPFGIPHENYEKEASIFKKTFELLAEASDEGNPLKRWDKSRQKFSGKRSMATFTIIAVGLGRLIEAGKTITTEELKAIIKDYWENPVKAAGKSSSSLALECVQRGKALFGVNDDDTTLS